ncbi:VOC family protein [Halioxenophilus sp. WMMB6]|uniref:VOC family protein n=1 Tax=Halioxenophilus sp. WMMB6 TaxID=3073815 RepID=UPI00295F302C|nr:VOC family protein [Halioxenophilus sp. WMMB6]
MIRGIHHIAVHVHDMERMIEFYRAAFGFEPIASRPHAWANDNNMDNIIGIKGSVGKVTTLKAGSCYLEMFEFTQPEPGSRQAKAANDKGYTHFSVDVINIEAEMARLAGLGMSFHRATPVANMGVVKSIYGKDPEGNIIELQETLVEGFELEDLAPVAKKSRRL